jgi:hypothetical protein
LKFSETARDHLQSWLEKDRHRDTHSLITPAKAENEIQAMSTDHGKPACPGWYQAFRGSSGNMG